MNDARSLDVSTALLDRRMAFASGERPIEGDHDPPSFVVARIRVRHLTCITET